MPFRRWLPVFVYLMRFLLTSFVCHEYLLILGDSPKPQAAHLFFLTW